MQVLLTLSLLSLLQLVLGYGSGAPTSACTNLTPSPTSHDSQPQDGPAPYSVDIDVDTYHPGEQIEVTLSANESFMGFLMVVTPIESAPSVRIGTFEEEPEGSKQACGDDDLTALTHNSKTLKPHISAVWIAPDFDHGPIKFRSTFVHNKATYWVDVQSHSLEPEGFQTQTSSEPPTTSEQPPTPVPTTGAPVDIDLTTCGLSKSCYRNPTDCQLDHCHEVVTWKVINDFVEFEVSGKLPEEDSYIAVGLSPTDSMGNASVVSCMVDDDDSAIHMSFNTPDTHVNEELNNPKLGLHEDGEAVSVTNGHLRCKYRRLISVTSDKTVHDADKVFDLGEDFYILVAKGQHEDFSLHPHDKEFPIISPDVVEVTSDEWVNIGGQHGYPLVTAHGCLMMLAWVVCASVGVLMPRYFKPVWADHKLFGKQVWFPIHQLLMSLTFLCTIVGFIIIFIEVGGYADHLQDLPDKAHPVLGIIVTILVITNPIMSMFRCGPADPKRPLFNWAHFCVGQSAHILAGATVWLGVNLQKSRMPSWSQWIVLFFICWHVTIETILAIYTQQKKSQTSESYSMKSTGMPKTPSSSHLVDDYDNVQLPDDKSKSKENTYLTILISTHFCVALGCAITLMTILGQN